MTEKLVLFDVDQTLFDLIHFYEKAFAEMFREVYGIKASLLDNDFGGKTIPVIILEVCVKKGVSKKQANEKLKLAVKKTEKYFLKKIKTRKRVSALPGVRNLLRELEKKGAVLGIITGGPRKAVIAGLAKTRLSKFFKVLATGENGGDKRLLAKIAKKKCEKKTGKKFSWKNVCLVGDSESEASSAKALGARSVSVATGFHSKARLRKSGTKILFGDFSDYKKVSRSILS
ncbi:MAG: HAD family hydrolase [Candidatus Micrarchaeia archaeon]